METDAPVLPTSSSLLPRWLPWSHAVLLLVTLVFWGRFLYHSDPLGYVYKRDFLCLYVGARAATEGHSQQLYDSQLQWQLTSHSILPYHRSTLLPFVYPEYVALLLAPLGRVSLVNAFIIWSGVNLLIVAWLARRLITHIPLNFHGRLAVLVAALAWVPLQLTLSQGQMGLVCTLAVTEALISLHGNRNWAAGCWLALGIVKPQLIALPLLALLLMRRWQGLVSFLVALGAVLAGSFAKAGFWIPAYWRFLSEFTHAGKDFSSYATAMQNWRGLVHALLGTDTSFAGRLLLGALSLASIVLVAIVCWRHDSLASAGPTSSTDCKARFSISILLGLLTSPHLYFHDWVLALPALTVLFLAATKYSPAGGRRGSLARALLWLVAISPFLCFAVQFQIWPSDTAIQLVPWFMGILTTIAVIMLQSGSDTFA